MPTEETTTPSEVSTDVSTAVVETVAETKVPTAEEVLPEEVTGPMHAILHEEPKTSDIEKVDAVPSIKQTVVTKTEMVKDGTETVEVEVVPEQKPEAKTPVHIDEIKLEVAKKVDTVETEEIVSPRFTTALTDITIMENNTLHLDVVFTGRPTPKVTWFLDGEPIKATDDLEIVVTETTSTMIIKDAYPEDEGEYWVEVSNKAGTARSTAYICILREYSTL